MADPDRRAADVPRDAPPLGRELSELIEDFAGLGLRDLKMIRDIYWRPRRVLRAMAAGSREEYGSAFRLWITSVGVLLFSSLLGGGMGRVMVDADERGNGSVRTMITEASGDYAGVINDFESWVSLLTVPVSALAMLPVIFLLRAFAGGIRLSRQLQTLAAITVSMTIPNILIMPFLMANSGNPAAILLAFSTYAIFMSTFARGGAGLYHHGWAGMAGKTAAIGGATILLNILASTAAMYAALAVAILQNTPA